MQRFRQILKELILNLHNTDEDQNSETIVYSYQVIEKKIHCIYIVYFTARLQKRPEVIFLIVYMLYSALEIATFLCLRFFYLNLLETYEIYTYKICSFLFCKVLSSYVIDSA